MLYKSPLGNLYEQFDVCSSQFKKSVSLHHLFIFLSFFFLSHTALKNTTLHSAGFSFVEFFSMHSYHTLCPATCFHLTILQTLLPVSAHLYLPFWWRVCLPPRPGSVSRAGSGSDSSLCPPRPARGWPQSRWQPWFIRGVNEWCDCGFWFILGVPWREGGQWGEVRLEAGKTLPGT